MTDSRTGSAKLHAGTISGAYGIQGWVRVHALTDPLENLLAFPSWYVASPGRRGAPSFDALRFEAGRRHGKGLIAKIAGVDDRTAAERLRGTQIWVDADHLAPLEEGEFYWHQLEGLEVWSRLEGPDAGISGTAAPVLLGVVDHLLETGANDVLVVAPCEGSVDKRERLLPYLPDDVVLRVDTQAGRIDVCWHPDD
jgi:16S rRNA processing protein RimM